MKLTIAERIIDINTVGISVSTISVWALLTSSTIRG